MKKNIARSLIPAVITLCILSSAVLAQSAQRKSVRRMESAVATAFGISRLGDLDAKRLRLGKIKIVIEHSIFDIGDRQFESRRFKNFKQAEQWLRSREREEGDSPDKYRLPLREVRPLAGCRSGICRYDFDGGILHNHLYLQKISYGYRNGRSYIKTIYLLNG